ncbi:hypothetical protein N0B31_01810 [Salinirubellus salinus]|uniref:ZIP Zinc transporter n=1 Tax=Salinirubellus salinus TaxID=1364945 RepID=A0A9E7R3T0_9EURY|nr:hypothetical protein [Salinirubellus salinus]UWM55027.1 hypothetical protein N0B31_01810 [Salinirubellus salinus]
MIDTMWLVQVDPTSLTVAAGLFTLVLSSVHLLADRLQFPGRWQRWWLSAAGGVSVAYVFILLLPEVSEAAAITGTLRGEAFLAEQLLYVAALLGFVVFYGVEVFVTQRRKTAAEDTPGVFWFHVVVFTLYSALIGYLLFHQEVETLANLVLYALAMVLHFLVTDYGLSRHHGEAFHRRARWVLAAGTLVGGVLGVTVDGARLGLTLLYGFVAGAIVLNVIKEELPQVDQNRFLAFVVGVFLYTVVLLLV